MDLKQIHELIKIINKSNIGEISIEDKDGKVTIKQKETQVIGISQPTTQVYNVPQQNFQTTQQPNDNGNYPNGHVESNVAKTDNLITIKSPMIGTFYRKAAPDKPTLIEIGDEVTPGKVVCIIEAMKLFNEIESEISGRIVKVLVEDASPVEYDQPLFLVDPAL